MLQAPRRQLVRQVTAWNYKASPKSSSLLATRRVNLAAASGQAPRLSLLSKLRPTVCYKLYTTASTQQADAERQLHKEWLTKEEIAAGHGRFSFTTANTLKLLLPLPNTHEKVVAFLLHTQQPLSYLETLIRAELQDKETPIVFLDLAKHATWSRSIGIADFIREAAATKQFCIQIGKQEIHVDVPSFEDRTQYLRAQLGRVTEALDREHSIKVECDELAAQTARHYALYVAGGLVTYWLVVFKLTFLTDYGWDTMEPITYMTSLACLILGYAYFLYHNREMSYSQVLHTAASARQQRLYQAKGFDMAHWRDLVDEGKDLRKEIRRIAAEYNVDWNEEADEYINNSHVQATKVLHREAQLEEARLRKRFKTAREEDLEDDGIINGSNESLTKRKDD
jgi:hypothetical protein